MEEIIIERGARQGDPPSALSSKMMQVYTGWVIRTYLHVLKRLEMQTRLK